MHTMLTGQFVERLLSFGGFHRHPELEVRAVTFPFLCHCLNLHVLCEYTRFLTLVRGPVFGANYTWRSAASASGVRVAWRMCSGKPRSAASISAMSPRRSRTNSAEVPGRSAPSVLLSL